MEALSTYSNDEAILDLGRTGYEACWQKQRRIHLSVALGSGSESIIITEHFPVYTCGRAKPSPLKELYGIPLFNIERGGDITYHGPGQIVGYPILNLAARRLSIPQYLRKLEGALTEALQEAGVQAEYKEKYKAGLWVTPPPVPWPSALDPKGQGSGGGVNEKKLVSIGIAVRRWVTFHGFALNVDGDLGPFRLIAPCGLPGERITSLKELGCTIGMEAMKAIIIEKLKKEFF